MSKMIVLTPKESCPKTFQGNFKPKIVKKIYSIIVYGPHNRKLHEVIYQFHSKYLASKLTTKDIVDCSRFAASKIRFFGPT